jgi:hypothetical protein
MLSLMFNDPCKAAHPVVEDALNVLKSEVIPPHRNRLFNFVVRMKFAILSTDQKAKSHTGSSLANTVGAAIGKYDASRISTPPLTHYGTLNFLCAPKKLTRASDDENSGSAFQNPEKCSR